MSYQFAYDIVCNVANILPVCIQLSDCTDNVVNCECT